MAMARCIHCGNLDHKNGICPFLAALRSQYVEGVGFVLAIVRPDGHARFMDVDPRHIIPALEPEAAAHR